MCCEARRPFFYFSRPISTRFVSTTGGLTCSEAVTASVAQSNFTAETELGLYASIRRAIHGRDRARPLHADRYEAMSDSRPRQSSAATLQYAGPFTAETELGRYLAMEADPRSGRPVPHHLNRPNDRPRSTQSYQDAAFVSCNCAKFRLSCPPVPC